MTTETHLAKQAVQDKLASQLKTAEATLDTLKARAEAAKANVEVKAAAELIGKKPVIQQKLLELKKTGEDQWERARREVETHIAGFEKSVKDLDSKVKRS